MNSCSYFFFSFLLNKLRCVDLIIQFQCSIFYRIAWSVLLFFYNNNNKFTLFPLKLDSLVYKAKRYLVLIGEQNKKLLMHLKTPSVQALKRIYRTTFLLSTSEKFSYITYKYCFSPLGQ